MELKRSDIIPPHQEGLCPICGGALTIKQDFPEHNSLPIDSNCNNCNLYYDSYQGMGDSSGRVGTFVWGWFTGAWDEQAYLQAILAAREEYNAK